jgi:hypothetical protein
MCILTTGLSLSSFQMAAAESKSSNTKPPTDTPNPVPPTEIEQAKEGEFYAPCMAKVTVRVITDDRVQPLSTWVHLIVKGAKKTDRLEFARSIATAARRAIDDIRVHTLQQKDVAEYVNAAKKYGARAAVTYFGDIDTEGIHKPAFDIEVEVDQIVPLAVL